MKSHLQLIPTGDMSRDQWLAYRMSGIGASEVSTILGLNPYKASIQLFYEKIGASAQYDLQSLAAFLGSHQEEFISDLWESYDPADGSIETMMKNYTAGKKIRRCKRVRAYVRNPDFPHLFVSLDFEINKYADRGNGTLETKTIGVQEADKWEAGFPPGYVIQVMTQTTVCEYLYGESAVLKGNRDFMVLPFEHNQDVSNTIITKTKDFWERVLEGRKIQTRLYEAEQNFNGKLSESLKAELQQLEPEPDGSDAFSQFMKERYQIAMPGEQAGTPQQLADALAHLDTNDRIKELDEQKKLFYNRLISDMGNQKCERLDFREAGYVSWKPDANGVRRFLNKVKTKK